MSVLNSCLKKSLDVALLCLFAGFLHAATLPFGFAELLVAKDLDPVTMAFAPDGRLFLLEKYGAVRIIENRQLKPDPFMVLEVDNFNERGLLGIAFDPDFQVNQHLYLYYTVKGAGHNRVSRFTATGDYVQPGSEVVLLNLDPLSGPHHNAGAMGFGPDGKLYIAVGEGTNISNSQNMHTLLGKILRINKDGTFPADNPFYATAEGKYKAIFAIGLRNPFAMAIQPGTGRIFTTDVGSNIAEEINEIVASKNYGYPHIEGYLPTGWTPPANYQDPVYAYPRTEGCAAVGAVFYNPPALLFPATYEGKFFFSDYCSGRINILDPATGLVSNFASQIKRPLNLAVGPDGTLYYLSRDGIGGGGANDNTSTDKGTLWCITYTGNGAPYVSVQPEDVLVSVGETGFFSVRASGNPSFNFRWQMNGVDLPGNNNEELTLVNLALPDSGALIRCIVTNNNGSDTSASAVLRVTSSRRPEPVILLPIPGATYRGGDLLQFAGNATDAEDGNLPAANLTWKIDFQHNTHSHPALSPAEGAGLESGTMQIPIVGETAVNVWYRVYLTATDQSGLSSTVFRDVMPAMTTIHVETDPPNLFFYLDGHFTYSPESFPSVIGISRKLEMPLSHLEGDSILIFQGWSNGSESNLLDLQGAEAGIHLVATYKTLPLGDGEGLPGFYFPMESGQGVFPAEPLFHRLDPQLDFTWKRAMPTTDSIGPENFLVRWSGFVKPLFDGIHTFHVVADDGARLWINGEPLVNAWFQQGPTEYTGKIELSAGVRYPITLEYFQATGDGSCQLLWSSDKISRSLIPRQQLYQERATPTALLDGMRLLIYPNPFGETLKVDVIAETNRLLEVEILRENGVTVLQQTFDLIPGANLLTLNLDPHPAGLYLFRFRSGEETALLKMVKR
jgi:glucose/arabinose dehydrogenase